MLSTPTPCLQTIFSLGPCQQRFIDVGEGDNHRYGIRQMLSQHLYRGIGRQHDQFKIGLFSAKMGASSYLANEGEVQITFITVSCLLATMSVANTRPCPSQ